MLQFIWAWGGFALATIVCAAAALWGGRTARVVAATFWIAWVLSLVVGPHGPYRPGLLIVLIDVVVLFIFVGVSLKTRRVWTVVAAACQLDDVASHLAGRLLHYGLFSSITATGIWGGYAIIACLLAGILTHRRDLRRYSAHVPAKGASAPLSSNS